MTSKFKLKLKPSNFLMSFSIVVLVGLVKLIFQYYNIEVFDLNPLLISVISGNIFILGFLLNSTLRDYKEAEKFPGEMASTIETMYDETEILFMQKKDKAVLECITFLEELNLQVYKWFKKEFYTKDLLSNISNLNKYWLIFEPQTQANFIVRLKNEQNNLRKMLIRVNIIRDTPFYDTAYKVSKISVILMVIFLTLLTSNPFYEYLFFVCTITFINVFLVSLIRDLDDPFEYHKDRKKDEISIKPFLDLDQRIKDRKKFIEQKSY